MAKRSPILGYNHNVRYRGLVFHVQTEDSGLLSPHLFTHLFYAGVIISTRKLVYDAGSAEDAIKSLMQAQHKAVMKDLKRGHFDDKIDQYLGSTPGLLPRGTVGDEAKPDTEPEAPRLAKPSQPIQPVADSGPTAAPSELEPAVASRPTEQNVASQRMRRDSTDLPMGLKPTKLDVGDQIPRDPIVVPRTITPTRGSPPRTKTADRTSAPSAVRTSGGVTDLSTAAPPGSVVEAIQGATTKVAMQHDFTDQDHEDSSPEIEIRLDLEDDSVVRRQADLDDETRRNVSDGIPGALTGSSSSSRTIGESALPPPAQSDRKVSLGAASLPPARPISRPPSRPAITPPQVMSRPATDERGRHESDAVEVYAPAPPSVDAPPGAAGERPGQYAQHSRRAPSTDPRSTPTASKSGSIPSSAIPPGLGRPGRMQSPSSSGSAPVPVRDVGSAGHRPRTPTPPRVNSPSRPASNNSGVVMTRPAVIVGAPPKPQSTTQRVRKAREEEGRGFGQGLISEKSLDEVILAYLSEDADDK